jgi:hypothetical protein
MAVDEGSEFWGRLARRINDKLRATRDNNLRFLWVDDFVPGTVLPQLEQRTVLAMAFVSEDSGRSFVQYRVRLRLRPSAAEAYRKGEWRSLLSDPDTTGLSVNREDRQIEIDYGQ